MSAQAGIPPYGTKGLSRRCFPTGDENPRPGFKESNHMTLIDILRWTASISGNIFGIYRYLLRKPGSGSSASDAG